MPVIGDMLVGACAVRGRAAVCHAVNPATGAAMEAAFGGGGEAEVVRACAPAREAFDAYRETGLEKRARFLVYAPRPLNCGGRAGGLREKRKSTGKPIDGSLS